MASMNMGDTVDRQEGAMYEVSYVVLARCPLALEVYRRSRKEVE